MIIDRLITEFDKGLRTLLAETHGARPQPDRGLAEPELTPHEKRKAAALMRVNHSGEVCAQALYNGQALTARSQTARQALVEASNEETEHLAWCGKRIHDLGSHKSLLNPLWYGGSFAIGALAGALGDRWNLGFLAETERQVCKHLEGHLQRLPESDDKSRAILKQMHADEAKHATTALAHGGAELPLPVKLAMRATSKIMTRTAYWI